MISSTRQRSTFPDLATDLMQHTWLALLYTVLCVAVIYTLGRLATSLSIFVAIQVPTVAAVSAATFRSRHAFPRVPFVWLVTAVLILTFFSEVGDRSWTPAAFAVAAATLVAYSVWRAILGTGREYGQRKDALGLPATIAVLIASWGATVQIAVLASLSIRGEMLDLLCATGIGNLLIESLTLITLTSPTAWFPSGIILLGVITLVAIRFAADPYRPRDFDEILSEPSSDAVAVLFNILRFPTWMVMIILGFLAHFAKHLWLALGFFMNDYLGRFLFLIFTIVLPILGLSLSHWCCWIVADTVRDYLGTANHSIPATVAVFLAIHTFALTALSLYAVSAGPLLMRIEPGFLKLAAHAVLAYASHEVLLAANAIGRVFSLFGILFVALPVAALLPGSPRFGPFSITYSVIVILALGWVRLREPDQQPGTA